MLVPMRKSITGRRQAKCTTERRSDQKSLINKEYDVLWTDKGKKVTYPKKKEEISVTHG